NPSGALLSTNHITERVPRRGPDGGLVAAWRQVPRRKSALRGGRTRPVYCKRQDPLQQVIVGDSVVQGRGGEFLDAGDLRIGIGLDVVGRAVRGEPKIDAGITVKGQGAVDSLGEAFDPRNKLRG